MRHWLTLPLILLLSGCWISTTTFYTPDAYEPAPFTTGAYRADGDPQVARIIRRPDGSVTVDDASGGSQTPYTFHRLPAEARRVWVMQMPMGDAGATPGAIYGLAEVRGDGGILIAPVPCPGNEALARSVGATIDINGSTCLFPTRAALEQGLAAYLAAHDPVPAERVLRRVRG